MMDEKEFRGLMIAFAGVCSIAICVVGFVLWRDYSNTEKVAVVLKAADVPPVTVMQNPMDGETYVDQTLTAEPVHFVEAIEVENEKPIEQKPELTKDVLGISYEQMVKLRSLMTALGVSDEAMLSASQLGQSTLVQWERASDADRLACCMYLAVKFVPDLDADSTLGVASLMLAQIPAMDAIPEIAESQNVLEIASILALTENYAKKAPEAAAKVRGLIRNSQLIAAGRVIKCQVIKQRFESGKYFLDVRLTNLSQVKLSYATLEVELLGLGQEYLGVMSGNVGSIPLGESRIVSMRCYEDFAKNIVSRKIKLGTVLTADGDDLALVEDD